MRVFISIDLPEKIVSGIKKIQDILPEFKGKKTETENLHLTLKFLGEVDEARLEEIKKKLKEIKFLKFEAEIKEAGVFSENFIRIVWIEISNCSSLQKEVDKALEGLFEREKRFMGHLTIARVKNVEDKKIFLEQLKKIKLPKLKFKVGEFKLKSSVLTEKGPIYSDIENYALGN